MAYNMNMAGRTGNTVKLGLAGSCNIYMFSRYLLHFSVQCHFGDTTGHTGKHSEIWDPGVFMIFDLLMFNVILGSFGALV